MHPRHRAAPERHWNRLHGPLKVNPDDIAFRILCNIRTGGAVIGISGSIAKQLHKETSARIHCFDPVPGCHQRVILIVGSKCVNRVVDMVNDQDESDKMEFRVSAAQEALYRVTEMILRVEGGREGCRLLVDSSQIGWVIGKGGKTIQKMMRESGATIQIYSPPACALPSENLIQITGDCLAMNKALHSVSCCLQNQPPIHQTPIPLSRAVETPSNGVFPDPHSEFFPHLNLPSSHLDGISGVLPVNGISISEGASGSASENMENQQEVVFRLLCPSSVAGSVIGHRGSIIRALQNETGACIIFAAPVDGCPERVITISAMEDPESRYSPVQNGIFRVYDSYIEFAASSGMLYDLRKGCGVQARLLVESDIVDVLRGTEGKTVSEIKESTGADIEILDGDQVPACGLADDFVLQISGNYKNVRSAMFQVTSRLRKSQLCIEEINEESSRLYPSIPIPPISLMSGMGNPEILQALGLNSEVNQETSITGGMEHLVISSRKGDSSLHLEPLQGAGVTVPTVNGTSSTTSRGTLSGRFASVIKTTTEIIVPKELMGSIYGENGNNLAQIRQISGASVEVSDPKPGEDEGKVTISGIPKQAMAAKKLLQAFLLVAE